MEKNLFPNLDTDIIKIMQFLREARKMQLTYRFTPKPNDTFENDAEHSWSVALICMMLATRLESELGVKLDHLKIMKMAIIHDIAEIRTGDTKTWDATARVNKEEKEREAFYSMTSVLPDDLRAEIIELWEECEKRETLEAKIVKSIDRLDPVLHRVFFEMGWENVEGRDGTVEALDERQLPRHEFSQIIMSIYNTIRDEAVGKGMFKKD